MKFDRLKEIEYYVLENESASIDKLCEVFNVSKNTIRRDLNELIEKGKVEKIYGGVIAKNRSLFISFEERNLKNKQGKAAIGEKAASFIRDNDTIFIDSGTTTLHLVDHIKKYKNLTVVTNNLHVITLLFFHKNIRCISIGGVLIRKTSSFAGVDSYNTIRHYNFSKAFMSATGVSIENGLTNSSEVEFELKKAVTKKSGEIYLLADSSKFGISSLLTYCPLEDVDCVISESNPPEKYLNFFRQHEINFVCN